jgi:hypothetical protein
MKAVVVAGVVLLCALVGKGWHVSKDGFNVNRLRFLELPLKGEDLFNPELKGALSQNYVYLGRGHQCYALASEDGKYVLKLPRADLYRLPFWLRACSFSFLDPLKKDCREDKKRRFEFLFSSFSLAAKNLREETGVLYSHLEPTDHLQIQLSFKDPFHRTYLLNLDQTIFILQKKQSLMIPLFKNCLKEGKREKAKEILDSFLDLVAYRARQGISNKDGSFLRNFGYDGEKVVQIDIGSFYFPTKEPFSFSVSFQQTTEHVVEWLKTIDQDMQSWFEMRVAEIVSKEIQV